ncbi:TetR family transcriptional regulator [Rhodobacterales bacterium 52_120_T64]|nr:TetR family transcriptional regulator [Rhodobacterales bacterium 52_120_T64]
MSVTKTNAEKPEVGRAGILNAAASLFCQHGYGGVSLRAIAEAAGIKAGSIYYHFASKDAIVTEILDAGILSVHDEARAAVEALPNDTTPDAIFRAAVRGHLHALLEHGDYTSANVRIFGQVPPAVRDANLPVRKAYEKYLDDLLSDLQATGAIREGVSLSRLRLLLIGALNATLEWFDPEQGGAEALADDYADTFLNGILNKTGDNT